MPPVFWIWAGWRDKGGIMPRPKLVQDYINAHGRIPATWWARYLIHKGIKKVTPTPTPPGPALYVLFADVHPELVLQAPTKYAVALSADPAFRDPHLADTITALRLKGHRVAGWCDCSSTPAAAGLAFVGEYGLDYFIGQAENDEQFDDAFGHGAHVIVGNLTALTGDRIAKLDQHQILWIQEDFWNEGWALLRDDRVAAVMHGIYPTTIWNPTVAQYKSAGRWKDGDGLFHVISVTDWSDLP
jgi:hypothetical protein